MSLYTIAKPYAKAAFQFACESNQVAEWGNSLHRSAEICSIKEFQLMTLSPSVSADEVNSIWLDSLNTPLPVNFEYFVQIVVKNSRYLAVPNINELYGKYLRASNGTHRAVVRSAIELSQDHKEKIQRSISSLYKNRTIQAEFEIDANLILGFVIEMDDNSVFDASISSRLRKLEYQLTS